MILTRSWMLLPILSRQLLRLSVECLRMTSRKRGRSQKQIERGAPNALGHDATSWMTCNNGIARLRSVFFGGGVVLLPGPTAWARRDPKRFPGQTGPNLSAPTPDRFSFNLMGPSKQLLGFFYLLKQLKRNARRESFGFFDKQIFVLNVSELLSCLWKCTINAVELDIFARC